MKLLYDDATGKIYYAVPDVRCFYFSHTTNIPLTDMNIDELIPNNQALCIDLRKTINKVDAINDAKYKIDSGQLVEKEGWAEADDEL